MKKDQEWVDANHKKLNNSLLYVRKKVKRRDQQILDLKSTLSSSKEQLVHLSPQIVVARSVCDHAFAYSYRASEPSC